MKSRKALTWFLVLLLGSSFFVGYLGLAPVASAVGEEWLSGWNGSRVECIINQTDIDADLTNFPVLIHLSNSSSGENSEDTSFVFDELQDDANRKKIAVTLSDGTTQCYVEIEKWDDANEQAWLHVKVPFINSTENTSLYLYYDVTHDDNTDYVGDPNSAVAEAVWDDNYYFVSHMQDDPDNSNIRDSTQYDNDGAKTGGGEPVETTTGKIGNAQSSDGTNDGINIGNINLHSAHTIECWVSKDGSDYGLFIAQRGAGGNAFQIYIRPSSSDKKVHYWNGATIVDSATGIEESEFTHVVVTHDGANTLIFYRNGQSDGSRTEALGSSSTEDIRIQAAATDFAKGIIDEVRISNITRSPSWVKASYETQIDHLLDWGAEEVSSIQYVTQISNIDGEADIGTHSNFTAQTYGPDLINDTLTEANVVVGNANTTLLNDGFEVGTTNWDGNGASGWSRVTSLTNTGETINPYAGSYFAAFPESTAGQYLASDNMDMSAAVAIYVSFWYFDDDLDPGDFTLTFYDGAGYDTIQALDAGTESTWQLFSAKITDSQYFDSTFHIRIDCATGNNEAGGVDAVTIIMESVASANYRLEIEEQFTGVNYMRDNEELCIFTGNSWTGTTEDLMVQAWNGSWNWVMNLTANQWNNASVSTWLTSSNFTIRFLDGTQSGDTSQNTWTKDCTLLHTWDTASGNYTYLAVSFSTSNSFTVGNVNWTARPNISLSTGENFNTLPKVGMTIIEQVSTDETYVALPKSNMNLIHQVSTGENFALNNTAAFKNTPQLSTDHSFTALPQSTFKLQVSLSQSFSWSALVNSLFNVVSSWSTEISFSLSLLTTRIITVILSWASSFSWLANTGWLANLAATVSNGFNWVVQALSSFNLLNSLSTSLNWVLLPQSLFNLTTGWSTSFSYVVNLYHLIGAKIISVVLSLSSSFTYAIQTLSSFNLLNALGSTLNWSVLPQSLFNLSVVWSTSFSYVVNLYQFIAEKIISVVLTLTNGFSWVGQVTSNFNLVSAVLSNLGWGSLPKSVFNLSNVFSGSLSWGALPQSIFNLVASWSTGYTLVIDLYSLVGAKIVSVVLSLSNSFAWFTQASSTFNLLSGLTGNLNWSMVPQSLFTIITSVSSQFTWLTIVSVIQTQITNIVLTLSTSLSWSLDLVTNILANHVFVVILTWITANMFQFNFPMDYMFDNGLVLGAILCALIIGTIGLSVFIVYGRREDD